MANFVGFNIESLTNAIRGLDSAYGDLENVLYGEMQTNFINVMADKWACQHAINFFAVLKESVDDLLNKSFLTFQSINNAMNAAGVAWDETTHSGLYTKVQFDFAEPKKVDVSGIQENIAGERGIDPTATDQAATLKGFMDSVSAALAKAQNAVQDCGFLGNETAATLQQSIATIKNSAEEATGLLVTEFEKALSQTLEEYGNVSNVVTSNMTV